MPLARGNSQNEYLNFEMQILNSEAAQQVTAQLEQIQKEIAETGAISAQSMQNLRANVSGVEGQLNTLRRATTLSTQANQSNTRSVNRSTQGMIIFAQGLEDAQYGIRGFANNLQQLAIVMGLSGPIVIGITALLLILGKLQRALSGTSEAASKAKTSLAEMLGPASGQSVATLEQMADAFERLAGEQPTHGLLGSFGAQIDVTVAQTLGLTGAFEKQNLRAYQLRDAYSELSVAYRVAAEEQRILRMATQGANEELTTAAVAHQRATEAIVASIKAQAEAVGKTEELRDVTVELEASDEMRLKLAEALAEAKEEFALLTGPGGRYFMAQEIELEQTQKAIKELKERVRWEIALANIRAGRDPGLSGVDTSGGIIPPAEDPDAIRKAGEEVLKVRAKKAVEEIETRGRLLKGVKESNKEYAKEQQEAAERERKLLEKRTDMVETAFIDIIGAIAEGGDRLRGVMRNIILDLSQELLRMSGIMQQVARGIAGLFGGGSGGGVGGAAAAGAATGNPILAGLAIGGALLGGLLTRRRSRRSVYTGSAPGTVSHINVSGALHTNGRTVSVAFDNENRYNETVGIH